MLKRIVTALYVIATLLVAAPGFAASKGSVLFILSATHELPLKNGEVYENAGVYLGEVAEPVRALLAAGYTPVFASPRGTSPTIDPFSEEGFLFKGGAQESAQLKTLLNSLPEFKKPRKLSDILAQGTEQYAAVFVPGGFAPMGDLMTDKETGKILLAFHESKRPIAMVCHGPLALISTLPNAQAFKDAIIANDFPKANALATEWPFAGYRLTIFSSGEEPLTRGPLKGREPLFWVSDAMAQAGAHVDRLPQGAVNVIEDRELLTGQNPFSAAALSDLLVDRLNGSHSDGQAAASTSPKNALEQSNQTLVVEFYKKVLFGLDADAAAQYIGEPYIQHNPAKQNGLAPLQAYIRRLQESGLHPASTIEHVYSDGDIVVLHVHAKKTPDDRGQAVVDMFRVKDHKIVEHWDVLQDIPEVSKNSNSMF